MPSSFSKYSTHCILLSASILVFSYHRTDNGISVKMNEGVPIDKDRRPTPCSYDQPRPSFIRSINQASKRIGSVSSKFVLMSSIVAEVAVNSLVSIIYITTSYRALLAAASFSFAISALSCSMICLLQLRTCQLWRSAGTWRRPTIDWERTVPSLASVSVLQLRTYTPYRSRNADN